MSTIEMSDEVMKSGRVELTLKSVDVRTSVR